VAGKIVDHSFSLSAAAAFRHTRLRIAQRLG